MQFKVTLQYPRSEERPIAEFISLPDALLFIQKKSHIDLTQNIAIVYRVYDGYSLLNEFNKERVTIPMSTPDYASGHRDLPKALSNKFSIEAVESAIKIATISELDDAKRFIEEKLLADMNDRQEQRYALYEDHRHLETYSQETMNSGESSEGNAKKVSFRPSPLQTSPAPPGSPRSPWVEEDDDEAKD